MWHYGQPFVLYETMTYYGMYGTLGGGVEIGNPNLIPNNTKIVAISHDGFHVMFCNGYEPETLMQWNGHVGGGHYGPIGEESTLHEILEGMIGFYIDTHDLIFEEA